MNSIKFFLDQIIELSDQTFDLYIVTVLANVWGQKDFFSFLINYYLFRNVTLN